MISTWYPDTCSCVIEQITDAQGLLDFGKVVPCALHSGIAKDRDLALLILQFHRNKRDYVKSLNLAEGEEAALVYVNGTAEVTARGAKKALVFRNTLRSAIEVNNG